MPVKRLSLKATKSSPWLKHVDETIKEFPDLPSYKEALKKAKLSYTPVKKTPTVDTDVRPEIQPKKPLKPFPEKPPSEKRLKEVREKLTKQLEMVQKKLSKKEKTRLKPKTRKPLAGGKKKTTRKKKK
jgi:hypothetical protein